MRIVDAVALLVLTVLVSYGDIVKYPTAPNDDCSGFGIVQEVLEDENGQVTVWVQPTDQHCEYNGKRMFPQNVLKLWRRS